MRSLVRVGSVAALLGAMAALGIAAPASACIGQYMTGDPHLDRAADLIFTGTAVRMDESLVPGLAYEWTFVVDGVEKGSVGPRMTVRTFQQESMCGMRFELGTRYRVLASRGSSLDPPQVSSVGGTQAIEPLADMPPIESEFQGPGWVLVVASVAVLGFAGLALWKFGVGRRQSDPEPT